MSLATTFSESFPVKVRKRGTQYWRDGLVTVTACDAERVKAVVSGTEDYQVALRRDDKLVWASCTCPYSGDRGELCKHVWAAVLAADEQGGLRGPKGGLPRDIFVNGSGSDDEDGDASPGPAVNRSSSEAWRKILEPLVRAGAAPPVQEEEILYVINLPASLHRHALILELETVRRKDDGSWGDLRPLRLTRGQIPQRRDPRDRAILSLLYGGMGAIQSQSWASWSSSRDQEMSWQPWVPNELAQEIARRLCHTGRCHLRRHAQVDPRPLSWEDGPAWELWLSVRETEDGGCEMVPELRGDDQRLDARELPLLGEAGLVIIRHQDSDQVVPIELGGAAAWLPLLRRAGSLRVPAEEREDFLEMLLAAPVLPRLELPESMRVDEVTLRPQPRVRLFAPTAPRSGEWPQAKVSFVYEGLEVEADAGRRGMYQRAERRILLRDQETENQFLGRLLSLGMRTGTTHAGDPTLRIAPSRVPQAVRALLSEGWSVEAQGKLYRSAGRSQVRVASGIDWFELHGGVEFEGELIDLPRLLAALRRGDDFIPLGDGSVGLLPEEWLRRWAPLAGLGEVEGDHLRFEVPQAVLLDAWLAEEPEADVDETFAQARERLHGFAGIEAAEAPAGFRGELRPYQRLGLGWLHFLRDFGLGGCLADDMGLGKTVQVLALLESRRVRRASEGLPPSLVVVPRSLVFNWLAEAAQFTPELRILDHTGAGRAGDAASFNEHDVVVTTYGTLRRDIALLKEKAFDYLILDEAQAIKNAGSQTAKAARLLRGSHRLALTGTPVENHLGELWSLLEFLNPGFLGSSTFQKTADLRDPDAASREILGRALRPLILRRTKGQVATELPERIEQTLFCELPLRQRRLYDEMRDYYRAMLDKRIDDQGLGKSKMLALEALLRLRQAACHPALLDRGQEDDPCAKLDLLLPHLIEVLDEGHKALVFSQFTSFLSLLRRRLDAEGLPYLYLDGKTRNRQELVETFQADTGSTLFLISLKAGGLGLNLTAADYVYLLDPWWNPAVEAQAIDRAHRIGQTRPVFAYRLVARDTVEEKILELQAGKRALADAIVRADQSVLASLSQEDLELLLS